MLYRRVLRKAGKLALPAIIGLVLLSSLPTTAKAEASSLDLVLGGEGATSWNISNWNDPEVFAGIHRGGVTATNATIAVWENFEETIDTIAQWYLKFDKYADIIMPVKTVADIKKAKAEGKSGIIFGFQNSSPVEDDLRRLRVLHELGVRVIQITYNNMNFVGAGYSESPDYGLSRFGRDFILECNRLGILVDLSHVGDRTVMDAIEVTTKPIAFTHVGPRALFHHYRNKTDEQLKALVAKGGVVGATLRIWDCRMQLRRWK